MRQPVGPNRWNRTSLGELLAHRPRQVGLRNCLGGAWLECSNTDKAARHPPSMVATVSGLPGRHRTHGMWPPCRCVGGLPLSAASTPYNL